LFSISFGAADQKVGASRSYYTVKGRAGFNWDDKLTIFQ
jgi:hypothetical protein